ncbi:hypothetical protein V3C99_004958 [Haemonchus contortus]
MVESIRDAERPAENLTLSRNGRLLKYPHTASGTADMRLRGEPSGGAGGFHWPDFAHILDVLLVLYKMQLAAVFALLLLLALIYIMISVYGIRVTKGARRN